MNTVVQTLFMTNAFVTRLFEFQLGLKQNPSKVDKEDFEFGQRLLSKLRHQLARMMVTEQPHLDIIELLNIFPDDYRNGSQQDVTETVLNVFDKLGGQEQGLVRDVF